MGPLLLLDVDGPLNPWAAPSEDRPEGYVEHRFGLSRWRRRAALRVWLNRIRDCRARMQQRLPAAVQLIYDNYNFLVIGFGPTRRPSEAVFSLASHARGVNLCFLQRGPELPDPTGVLRGSGTVVRNVPLDSADDLDRGDVQALMNAALSLAAVSFDTAEGPQVIIQSVSEKQRPRR